jgi:hypothetical protein
MRAPVAIILLLAVAGAAVGCGAPATAPAATPDASTTPAASPTPAPSATAPVVPSAPTSAGPTGGGAEVRVFFVPGGADPCGTVAPAVRMVAGPVTAEVALGELLAGPTTEEAAAGFSSLFGPATADALLHVVMADGIARVSFRDLRLVIPNASSSCGSAALLTALDATLAQVPGVRGARYSFDGDEAAFYEWLQMAPPD